MSVKVNTAYEYGGKNYDNSLNNCTGITNRAAFNAGFYALAAYTFTIANPALAAAFGAASSLARTGIRYVLEKENFDRFDSAIAKTMFVYGSAAAAGAIFMGTVGMPIAFTAAVDLTVLLWAVNYLKCIGKITE
jgi:hypothetical protein